MGLPEECTQTELLVRPDKEAIREALEQGQKKLLAPLTVARIQANSRLVEYIQGIPPLL